jgi:hypothetical protein
MKYLIILSILSILILFLVSCETNVDQKQSQIKIEGMTLKIYIIDECEYYSYCFACNSGILTHKGNCSNPIHKCPCQ